MIVRSTLKAAALASVCLIPLAAAAQDDTGFEMPEAAPNTQALKDISAKPAEAYDNEATIGIKGQSSQSAVYGRYNGNYNYGPEVTGSLRMRSRDDWRQGGTSYFDFNAKDLSLGAGDHFDLAPNSSVNLRVGNQGSWGLTAAYDAMTYVQSNNFTTIFDKNGTLAGGVRGTSASSNAGLNQYDVIGTRRDKGLVGLNFIQGNWVFTGGLTHEHKEGTMEQTGLETSGGNGGFASFPQPINYDTDRFDLTAAHNTQKWQTKLAYSFSNFRDNNSAFHYAGYRTNATTGAYQSGYYSLPPSNMAHALTLMTGYNITDTTRLNGNFQYGLQLQDQGFVPATATPYGSGLSFTNFSSNPSSLNGMVQTVFGNVAITSRPFAKADAKASYTIDGRINNTESRWIYGDASDSPKSANLRYAAQPSWVKQKASLEGGYRVLDSTKLTLGYTFRQDDRTEAITANTKEHEFSAKARTTFSPDLVGSLGVVHSDRTASASDFTLWSTFIAADCFSGGKVTCQQVPFYETARHHNAVDGRLTQTVSKEATASLMAKYEQNRYPVSYGITDDHSVLAGPDVTYRFSQDADMDVFYTFQQTYRRHQAQDGNGNWNEGTTSNTHTAGLSGTWKVSDKLKFGASNTFSLGLIDIAQSGVWATNFQGSPSLPQISAMDNAFKLHGEYEFVPGVSLYMGYGFDRMISSDWALWGQNPTSASGTELTTGEGNPSYAVHSVISRVSFKW